MSDPYIGKNLSEKNFTVSETLLADFYSGLALDRHANTCVPTMILSDVDNGYFGEIAFGYQIGHLWMRQEWELLSGLDTAEVYTVSGEIEDIYSKRNRNVVKYRVDMHDSSDKCVAIAKHHQSFLKEQIEGERVAFRSPSHKPGARRFDIPQGAAFGGLTKTITKEMCGIFFHGDANYHTDDESAKELGFEQVVVGGRMTMSYAGCILEDHFSDRWLNSGKLDLKFTNPVWCGDEVTVQGVILADQLDRERTSAFVWMSKKDGTIAFVAEASVSN